MGSAGIITAQGNLNLMRILIWLFGGMLGSAPALAAQEHPARATYLANAGVMVTLGETRILFDPLYRLNHTYYESMPEYMENDVLVGAPPFDGIDAVFVSHFHRDHFSPNLLLNYLMINTEARLFAPEQAVAAMRRFAGEDETSIMERVVSVDLTTNSPPVRYALAGIDIEAVRVPHSGWPEANRDTQNLVFRVTLQDSVTVLHFGDAITQPESFARLRDHWAERSHSLALPPYWFFLDEGGLQILSEFADAKHTVGVHVPTEVPRERDQRETELQAFDLFTQPGETRELGRVADD